MMLFPSHALALEKLSIKGDQIMKGSKAFVPFGYYYGEELDGSQSTDSYFQSPSAQKLQNLKQTLSEAKRDYGANIFRITLDFPTWMPTQDRKINPVSVKALQDLAVVSASLGTYLLITGNTHFYPEKEKAWYKSLGEQDRWNAQAAFFEQLARNMRGYPAIAYYELTNEPVIAPGSSWYLGKAPGYTRYYAQNIARELRGRSYPAIAQAWTSRLSSAIRRGDKDALVSIGALNLTRPYFGPASVGRYLDLFTPHFYPSKENIYSSSEEMRSWASGGKPVVLGETMVLYCTNAEMKGFLFLNKRFLDGYISAYHGISRSEKLPNTPSALVLQNNLNLFYEVRPSLCDGKCS